MNCSTETSARFELKPTGRATLQMAMTLRYPVFLIASLDGIVVARINGNDRIMLFHEKFLAERQIETIQSSHPLLGALYVLPVRNAEALRDGLKLLPADAAFAIWDPIATRAGFTQVAVDDLIRAAESG